MGKSDDNIKVNGHYTDSFKDKVRDAVHNGKSLYDAAKLCGVDDTISSGFRQLYYKIKREENDGVVIKTLRSRHSGSDYSNQKDTGIKGEDAKIDFEDNVDKSVASKSSVAVTEEATKKVAEKDIEAVVSKSDEVDSGIKAVTMDEKPIDVMEQMKDAVSGISVANTKHKVSEVANSSDNAPKSEISDSFDGTSKSGVSDSNIGIHKSGVSNSNTGISKSGVSIPSAFAEGDSSLIHANLCRLVNDYSSKLEELSVLIQFKERELSLMRAEYDCYYKMLKDLKSSLAGDSNG